MEMSVRLSAFFNNNSVIASEKSEIFCKLFGDVSFKQSDDSYTGIQIRYSNMNLSESVLSIDVEHFTGIKYRKTLIKVQSFD